MPLAQSLILRASNYFCVSYNVQAIVEIYTYACCITECCLGILRAASLSRFKLYDCIARSVFNKIGRLHTFNYDLCEITLFKYLVFRRAEPLVSSPCA